MKLSTNYECNEMIDVKLWLFYRKTWKHLTLYKKNMSFGSFKNVIYIIYIVIHRQICFVRAELFSVVRQARIPEAGIETPIQDSSPQPRGKTVQAKEI